MTVEQQLQVADIVLDPVGHVAHRGERELRLGPRMFEVLELFLRHPRQVLSRGQVYESVWGYDFDWSSNALPMAINALRRELGEPPVLHTIRGVGFILRG